MTSKNTLAQNLQLLTSDYLQKSMRKFILTLSLSIAIVLQGYCQDLPINKETGLVSVSNIVAVDTIKKTSLNQRVNEWVALYSNAHQTLMNTERPERRRKKEKAESIPNFVAEKKLDSGDKVIYFLMIDNMSKVSKWAQEYAKIVPTPEFTQCNLIVLFKDGKMKYEFTNFAHSSMDPVKNSSGGKYENEKPDASRKYMKQSYWKDVKQKTIEKVKLIAVSLEQYVKNPANTEMDF